MIGLIACVAVSDSLFYVPFRTVPDGTVRVGSSVWLIQYRKAEFVDGSGYPRSASENSFRVLKDGKSVYQEELTGSQSVVAQIKSPANFPVFFVKSHSGAGHGEISSLYGIRNGRFIKMLTAGSSEIGGPIYRDLDRDGQMEWIFDDYDWYAHHDSGPQNFNVFKLAANGRLVKWKTLKNTKRIHLPRDSRFRF